ncbi:MAG: hypothetical protein M3Z25_14795 [Actinomycetota bacterium]|nr:hypothetical protein [Actinomycetota bacterium]
MGERLPAYFVGGGPFAGHGSVETLPDGQPPPRLRVLVTEGPLLRIEQRPGSTLGPRTYGVYELSDDGGGSLIYEFVGEESE